MVWCGGGVWWAELHVGRSIFTSPQASEFPPPIKNPWNPISFQWFLQHLWASNTPLLTTLRRRATRDEKDGASSIQWHSTSLISTVNPPPAHPALGYGNFLETVLDSSHYPEGPATGHLGIGFSWFPCLKANAEMIPKTPSCYCMLLMWPSGRKFIRFLFHIYVYA
jgi:hypothetical protein